MFHLFEAQCYPPNLKLLNFNPLTLTSSLESQWCVDTSLWRGCRGKCVFAVLKAEVEYPSRRDKVQIAGVSKREWLVSSTRVGPVDILELNETFARQGDLMAPRNLTWKVWRWPFTLPHTQVLPMGHFFLFYSRRCAAALRKRWGLEFGLVSELCTKQPFTPYLSHALPMLNLGCISGFFRAWPAWWRAAASFQLAGATYSWVCFHFFKSLKTKVWISIQSSIFTSVKILSLILLSRLETQCQK